MPIATHPLFLFYILQYSFKVNVKSFTCMPRGILQDIGRVIKKSFISEDNFSREDMTRTCNQTRNKVTIKTAISKIAFGFPKLIVQPIAATLLGGNNLLSLGL